MIVQLCYVEDRLHLNDHVPHRVPGTKRLTANRKVFSGRCPRLSLLKVESELFPVCNELSIEIESVQKLLQEFDRVILCLMNLIKKQMSFIVYIFLLLDTFPFFSFLIDFIFREVLGIQKNWPESTKSSQVFCLSQSLLHVFCYRHLALVSYS